MFTPSKRLTIIESPFTGPTPSAIAANIAYARLAIRDSILRGEVPFASHLLYTQPGILDDSNSAERRQGIDLGHEFLAFAERIAVYRDRGMSLGMQLAIERALDLGILVEVRTIPGYEFPTRPYTESFPLR